MSTTGGRKKHNLILGADSEEIFDFPFVKDYSESVDFIANHGRIMFIIRGPPGTAKASLEYMIKKHHPTAVVCSADNYFNNIFSTERTNQNLALSHDYCHRKVKEACEKDKHPIIVRNTHLRKREMQEYLDYAAKYHYTVIMAVTLRKVNATPKLLEQSNRKGLDARYFGNRLRAWEEVPPIATGWFFSPDDSVYILNQIKSSVEALLGDGKFCRVLNVFDRDELMNYYKARKVLFCIAATCREVGRVDFKMETYYLSDVVQDNYGKCFSLDIWGYLVTSEMIIGIVPLTQEMKKLMLVQDAPRKVSMGDAMDELVGSLRVMSINGNIVNHSKMISLNQEFSEVGKMASLCSPEDKESISVKNSVFIHIAQNGSRAILKASEVASISHMLLQATNSEGCIDEDQFMEIRDVKVCRFGEDGWIIKPPNKIHLKSIFTGLYI